MLDTILSVLTGGGAAVAGGLFGTLGALASKWVEAKHEREMARLRIAEKKLDQSHELAVMTKEAEQAEKLANIQAERDVRVADMAALGKSITAEAKGATWSRDWASRVTGFWGGLAGFALVCVDVVRGLTRPLVTYYLIGLVTALAVRAFHDAGGLTGEQAFVLLARITDMVLFVTTTVVGWWFGSRPAGGRMPVKR